jgi:leucyl-tRNA synthetase
MDREAADKEKTGVFTGSYALNPINQARIPIWVADYVLMTYGTGAIMAVPAHDERDFAFATRFQLPIPVVIAPPDWDGKPLRQPWPGGGTVVNSGPWNGTPAGKGEHQSVQLAILWLEEHGVGRSSVNYKLRDWTISRQRYWGAPIPIIYCSEHGQVPVPPEQLPVKLPEEVEWLPTGQSPLKLHPSWSRTTCPICGRPAERDTDTMDTFMCSSWYHLRYLSPHYDQGPFDPNEYDYWMPVDTYTGGAEHATMHLIYTRFFHKAMRDCGITKGPEPMIQLRNQGQILGPDGQRMSKSRGNVIDPDEQVRIYGADVVRCYLMFGYRWSEGGPWNTDNIQGVVRWLRRLWSLVNETREIPPDRVPPDLFAQDESNKARADAMTPRNTNVEADTRSLRRHVHQTLKRISRDFEQFEFNTIVSGLMELMNDLVQAKDRGLAGTPAWNEALDIYLCMLAPVAPHIAEELWTNTLGKPYSVHTQSWPVVDEQATREEELVLPVQVNGKLRDHISVAMDATQEQIQAAALASAVVQKFMAGKPVRKVIVAGKKLVNIVV